MTGVATGPAERAVPRLLAAGLADTPTPATPVCPNCLDSGCACDDHPDKPWSGMTGPHPDACDCDSPAGMPCPTCCDPIPQDGRHSIREAFTPRHLRT